MELPTRQQVNEKRANDFKATITQVVANKKLDFFHQLIQSYLDEHDVDPIQLAGALAYLAQKEKPLVLEEAAKKSSARVSKQPKTERRSQSLRPNKDDLPKSKRGNVKVPMDNYRIEVGKKHHVTPGEIVGAIANEADVEPRHIGHIELNDEHSYVELPIGMPKIVFQSLKKVRVRNHPLNIEISDHVAKQSATSAKPAKGKKKTYTKKPKKKKNKKPLK